MAYRLAEAYAGKLLHVHGIGWHYWDGKRWAYDDTGAAKRAVVAVLRTALADSLGDKQLASDVRKCESAGGISGVLDIAAASEEFAATVRDLDADPHLLNVSNGTLDLRTMEMSPHNPADRITKVTGGAWNPDTPTGLWEEFLQRVLPDSDVRQFLQRYVGYGLSGRVSEHVLAIWTGTGANGKSVCDNAIRYALGDYAISCEPNLFMHRDNAHPTGEMDLMGRRWVTVSESEKGRKLAEATVKRLTGGDTIRARRMRKDFVQFEPSHTSVLITNHLPDVSGDDEALWRRLTVVPFDVVIPEEERDGTLGARLELQAEGILAWAVRGYAEFKLAGLNPPDLVKNATRDYRNRSGTVGQFINEACITGPAVKAKTQALLAAYRTWSGSAGVAGVTDADFYESLAAHGFKATRTRDGMWRQGIAVEAGGSND
nr:phage/plasmid primase, P4 family [Mycobacterium intracellulare]